MSAGMSTDDARAALVRAVLEYVSAELRASAGNAVDAVEQHERDEWAEQTENRVDIAAMDLATAIADEPDRPGRNDR